MKKKAYESSVNVDKAEELIEEGKKVYVVHEYDSVVPKMYDLTKGLFTDLEEAKQYADAIHDKEDIYVADYAAYITGNWTDIYSTEKNPIKELREEEGMSQAVFARKFNIPLRTYQSWELGERKPADYTIAMIRKIIELEKKIQSMKKIYVANRETGDFIEEVSSIEEGLKKIKEFESTDKLEGTYEPDFYDVVDEDHCTLL